MDGGRGSFVTVEEASDSGREVNVAVEPTGRGDYVEVSIPVGQLRPDMVLFRAPCGMLFTSRCVVDHARYRARHQENRVKGREHYTGDYPWDCEALDVLLAIMAEYGWES